MASFISLDTFISQFDAALRTLLPPQPRHTPRPTPAATIAAAPLTKQQQKHVAGLMRVNHAGEVCAQALYQGQALTAGLESVREKMTLAAEEEIDHLAWCEQRLNELNDSTSKLNAGWYLLSFTLGAVAGLAGDKWSLGFVAETERQVTRHLQNHLTQLPSQDEKSRAILKQMIIDETAHATNATEAGGIELPTIIKQLMTLMSKLMTKSSYHI